MYRPRHSLVKVSYRSTACTGLLNVRPCYCAPSASSPPPPRSLCSHSAHSPAPFAMQLLGLSPFLSSRSTWEARHFELDVSSFTKRLTVKAYAPPESWFTLGAPFPEGHRENALAQSFRATVELKIFHRPFVFMRWQELRHEFFENASLEFGGQYFGGLEPKGSESDGS